MPGKRSSTKIQGKIIKLLKGGELSVNAIAEGIKAEWAIAKRNLQSLEKLGIVQKRRKDPKKKTSPTLFRLKGDH